MKRSISALIIWTCLCGFFAACSGSKEEIQRIEPELESPDIPSLPQPRVFRYEDRYFVQHASIDDPTKIAEPMQAVRVIQLKEGENAVLVISSFEKLNEGGEDVAQETWFGVEMPSFEPGTYNVSRAVKISYYRFNLGKNGTRFDGTSYTGTITIESIADGYIIGSVDIVVSGVTKSFDKPTHPFTSTFTGSFKIQDVPFEATTMKVNKEPH